MRGMGLAGAISGKAVKTTVPDKAAPCPLDRVNRQFRADRPNAPSGIGLHVRVHLDRLRLRRLRDRCDRAAASSASRVSRTAHAGFVLDALEQALHQRRQFHGGLIHHSNRGVQCVSITYTERLALAGIEPSGIEPSGIEPSVGSVGGSYDNALAETINGLYKTELIHRRGPWKTFEAVEIGCQRRQRRIETDTDLRLVARGRTADERPGDAVQGDRAVRSTDPST